MPPVEYTRATAYPTSRKDHENRRSPEPEDDERVTPTRTVENTISMSNRMNALSDVEAHGSVRAVRGRTMPHSYGPLWRPTAARGQQNGHSEAQRRTHGGTSSGAIGRYWPLRVASRQLSAAGIGDVPIGGAASAKQQETVVDPGDQGGRLASCAEITHPFKYWGCRVVSISGGVGPDPARCGAARGGRDLDDGVVGLGKKRRSRAARLLGYRRRRFEHAAHGTHQGERIGPTSTPLPTTRPPNVGSESAIFDTLVDDC